MSCSISTRIPGHAPRDAKGRYDLSLVLAALMLASLGVVMVASSSIAVADGQHVGPFYYLMRHLVFLALGLAAAPWWRAPN